MKGEVPSTPFPLVHSLSRVGGRFSANVPTKAGGDLMQWRRVMPFTASILVAIFVIVLTLAYANAVRDQGIPLDPVWTWGGAAVTAGLFAGATYLVTALPERDRIRAQKVADGLVDRELHLQRLLAAAPIMMFRTDVNGVIQFMDGAALADGPDRKGTNLFDYGTEDEDWIQYAHRAIAGEDISAVIHFDNRDWEIRYQPWMVGDKPDGMLGIATDVTERYAVEQKERAERDHEDEMARLREMNDIKTQLLNTAAHELNTPMTPVRLQLHLLRSGSLGELTERQVRAMGILDRSVKRLGGLIDDILDVARLQSGKLAADLAPVRLRELLAEVVDTFQETAGQVGVRLQLEPGDDVVVNADADRVTQVLTNLASNAIKFTPEGGQIVVRSTNDGKFAEVSFEDTGRGLSESQIAKLFQPFSQVHDVKSVTARGSGLGLYICRGILDTHGGTIGVTSPGPGEGSRFHFTLPISHETPAAAAAPIAVPAPESRPAASPQGPLANRLRELI